MEKIGKGMNTARDTKLKGKRICGNKSDSGKLTLKLGG